MKEQAIKTIKTLLPLSGAVSLEEIENAVSIALLIPQYKELERNLMYWCWSNEKRHDIS